MRDRAVERVDQADAYQQEGQMTTFFALADERLVVDCWSTRLASFRTSEIMIVRRRRPEPAATPEPTPAMAGTDSGQGTYAPSQAIDDSATTEPPISVSAARSTCGGRITTARASTSGKALIP